MESDYSDADLIPFNYDNGLVTAHEDSDSDNSILNHSACTSTSANYDNIKHTQIGLISIESTDVIEVTREEIEQVELTPAEAFTFLLGTLNRIETYLKQFDDGNHEIWLRDKVSIVKTVLKKSGSLFQISPLISDKDGNDSYYIPENSKSQQNIQNKKNKASLTKATPTRKIPSAILNDSKSKKHNFTKPGTQLDLRRSKRLSEQDPEKKSIHLDKLAYVSFIISSALNRTTNETGRNNDKLEQKRKTVGSSSFNNKENTTVKSNQRKARSLCGPQTLRDKKSVPKKGTNNKMNSVNKATSQNKTGDISSKSGINRLSRKRRAKSVENISNKRVKDDEKTHRLTVSLSGAKKKLYSPEAWLEVFNSQNQDQNV